MDLDAARCAHRDVLPQPKAEARAHLKAEGVPSGRSVSSDTASSATNQEHHDEVLGRANHRCNLGSSRKTSRALRKEYTYRMDARSRWSASTLSPVRGWQLTMSTRLNWASPMQLARQSDAVSRLRLEGIHDATIYDGDALQPVWIRRPAIIEDTIYSGHPFPATRCP
jgi:hypothetical protein